jgi:hypothetical protein
MTSITQGRIMYNGKECQATWSKGMAFASNPELDPKAKDELAKAFSEKNFRISIRSEHKNPKMTVSYSSSSSGNVASLSNDPMIAAFRNMVASNVALANTLSNNAAQKPDASMITFMNSANGSHWTLSISALSPNQQPLLNANAASNSAAATKLSS